MTPWIILEHYTIVSKTIMFRHFSFKKEAKHVVAGSTSEVKHSSVRNEHQRSDFFHGRDTVNDVERAGGS